MVDYLDVMIETSKEKKKYFEDYTKYTNIIKKIAKKILGEAEVIIFGSFIENKHTMASDIDVLIISDNMKDRNQTLLEINKALGTFHPFELHLITQKEFEWYKRFIKSYVRV